MSVLEEVKAAAAKLNPDEQYEFFRWWVESEAFKARQLAALKRDVAVGIDQLERGRYRTLTGETVMQLAEDVSRARRERLYRQKGRPVSTGRPAPPLVRVGTVKTSKARNGCPCSDSGFGTHSNKARLLKTN